MVTKGPYCYLFENADASELFLIYMIVESGKQRNWDWLIEWMDGYRGFLMGDMATAEAVIRYYGDDEQWGYRYR